MESYNYNFVNNSTVRCVAKNAAGFGTTQLIAKYDLGNSSGYPYISYSERISPESHLISLECGAYHEHYFDNVTWLGKNGKIIETSDGKYFDAKFLSILFKVDILFAFSDILVERKRNQYNYQSVLHWDARMYQPPGELKCQAVLLKNGSIEENVWSVNESVRKLFVVIDGGSNSPSNNQNINTSLEMKQSASMDIVFKQFQLNHLFIHT